MSSKRFWLMKTEPETFSFNDLVALPNHTDGWDGIRNYQARNLMRDDFKKGDQVFIYHSNTVLPSIVGIAEVVKGAYPDKSALDPKQKYYDPKSAAQGESRWVQVDVKAKKRFKTPVSLKEIKNIPELSSMVLVKKGMRLSIQPVHKNEWDFLVTLGSPGPL